MNWYKKAQQVDVGNFILNWIRSSRDHMQDPHSFMEQVQAHAGHMVDPGEMRVSLNTASQQAASEQGGTLTPSQQQFIQSIMSSTMAELPVEQSLDQIQPSMIAEIDQVSPGIAESLQ